MTDPATQHDGQIPASYLDILQRESIGHLTTLDPDGWPQTTPVWTDHDGQEAVLVNTLRGRRKERNIARDPRVTISVPDPDNPYRYLAVRGRATMTESGAREHIDELARAYLDVDVYPHHDEEAASRVIVRIPASDVITRGRSEDR